MSDRTAFQRIRDEKGVVLEAVRHLLWLPRFDRLPKGDGHPVLVVPAFSVSDRGTTPLRRALRRLDYDSHGWEQGPNRGVTPEAVAALEAHLAAIAGAAGRPVSVVGWSLGGIFARMIARSNPDAVRRVIALGSPYRAAEERHGVGTPPVPTTSIYSKSDAVVDWRNASEPDGPGRESIEVRGTHSGLALNPAVISIIAYRLALPAVSRRPGDRGDD